MYRLVEERESSTEYQQYRFLLTITAIVKKHGLDAVGLRGCYVSTPPPCRRAAKSRALNQTIRSATNRGSCHALVCANFYRPHPCEFPA